jgi:integrase
MARKVSDANLETRTARQRLKVSGKPYYRSIDPGLHLGYRKGANGGRWVVRWYVGERNYRVETIGTADDRLDPDGSEILSFAQAQAKARELFVLRRRENAGLPANSGPYTVKDCLDEYLGWMEANRKSEKDSRYRVDALIVPKIGAVECSKLTTPILQKWLNETAKARARVRTKKGEAQQFRELSHEPDSVRRRRATANRTLAVLKAGLNRAWRSGKIATDDAWRRIEPFEEANAARVRYFTIDEAKRLINASDSDFRALVKGALATGARYGELAALRVSDFNPDSKTLHIRTSKSGKGRHIVLADEGVKLLASLTTGRSGDALIFTKNGVPWLASHQSRPMAAACRHAKIKPAGNFHCLRHTYASHAIMNGAPLLVVAKNLGHADTRMVEKHYGHLAQSYIADAIRAAAPQFGIESATNVVPIGTGA